MDTIIINWLISMITVLVAFAMVAGVLAVFCVLFCLFGGENDGT